MRRFLAGIGLVTIAAAAFAAQVKSRGAASAPITMDVYSDFQCPGCKALYETTLQPLIQNYVDKGKVLLVHHEYPLPIHSHSMEAACYACAANRVGKYDQVCDVLFRKQESWAATGKVDETVCSVLTAEEARKVRALAKDQSVIAEVQSDIQAGRAAHVDGTPTVILTHRLKQYRIPTGAGYDILRRFIDQLLTN
ncbi:MAG: DsbA family protein [Acidobacteriia bacterium]|nr:DsbA family protein [Terriglobia bacterium]